ncbi:LysR family transcriptional regulator [Salinarimonas ramus]|uniref:LysR family transcriptional regulator n=1 Tax=Salinarimonas ramus TaxID=690164 RepID=A0A917Q897_9HYPH|nr:LysR family transcriptional regulator [Salinarimonas ramus]GGK35682.1 LysR family transcriptional regulator [Salinarimonas ramus]
MQCSLRDMAIFVAAYEERSFTAAAQRENATQSGVSQHIRNLEHVVGVQLFVRERGGVIPTPAAASFYRSCLEVMRAHDAARRDVARFGKGPIGELRVGLMPTMTSRVLAPALDAFVGQAPNVAVHVVEGYSAALTQMVQGGELDFAVVPAFAGAPGVRARHFVRTRETLVSRPDSGLRHLAPVRLGTLGPLDLVLPGPGNTRRRTIETYCTTHGIEIARVVELDAMLGTLDLVARTRFVAVLPAIMMDTRRGQHGLTVNPIADPELPLDLTLIEPARRERSPASALFEELLLASAQDLNARWAAVLETQPRTALAASG